LLDIVDRATGRTPALSFHTRLVLTLTASAYVVGVVLLLAFDKRFVDILLAGFQGGWTPSDGKNLRRILVSASALCIESRSAGFPTEALGSLPRAANWVLLLLMAVGASPAGTAGGLKTTTLYVLFRGMRQGLRGDRPAALVGFALAWLFTFLGIVFVGYAMLLWSAPMVPAERVLTVAVSAASNCGLSHDPLSVTMAPLYILSLMMALGRIVPILLLWRTAERLEYAETVVG
jgi:trk system potassium uptake protein TrkH